MSLKKLQEKIGATPDGTFGPNTLKLAAAYYKLSPERAAHFFGQTAHETGNYATLSENLNYSADGLKSIFGKYFPDNLAASYSRQPEKIASRVYANRMGNGNEATGDGYKFRGRGYIQLTGRDNYTAFGKSIDVAIEENPDIVSTTHALTSAAWFWSKNKLNEIADTGATDEVVTKITKRVNGGTIGLADRIKHFKEFHTLLV